MDVIELIDERYAGRQIAQPTIALVPTMGALHAGHLALIDYAKTLADEVWVSIFVNPTQFGPNEDFQRYPRTLEADLAACKAHGVSTVFIPSVEMLYPQGPDKTTLVIPPADLASGYCGQSRLGHFAGVATIVLKLFNLVQPNIAIFGEKDAQQLAVIRRMVADLNLPVNVMGHPIVREADGLAMSSRNRYLTTRDARQAALTLFHVLQTIKHCVAQGETSLLLLMTCREHVKTQLLPEIAALIQWEYIAAVADDSFQPATQLTAGVRILVAARIVDAPHGVNVRLIDNQVL